MDNKTKDEPPKESVQIKWSPFPARRNIAFAALALVAIYFLVIRDLKSAWYLLFASLVMDLVEGWFDVFEENRPIKTGIFESNLKYFLFRNGGVAIIWAAIRALLPDGLINQTGMVVWGSVVILTLISSKYTVGAATRRAMRIKRNSADES